jgi:hypothetical protein
MESLVLLQTGDEEEWDEWIAKANATDVYYSRGYLAVLEANNEGQARMAVYCSPDGVVVYPFLLRDISVSGNKTGYQDITSPYGYGGPLALVTPGHDSSALARGFRDYLTNQLLKENVVSEFIRFHPLLENARFFSGIIDTQSAKETVYVDLMPSTEDIWVNSLHSKTRNSVRKGEKMGVTVTRRGSEGLPTFRDLYRLAMARVQAEPYYLFSEAYFAGLGQVVDRQGQVIEASLDGEPIASIVLLAGTSYAHYHLSASDPSHRFVPATDLLLWEAIQWAKEREARSLHLGGGYSGATDSLFRFKAGFSRARAEFYVGRVVVNPDAYDSLVNQTGTSGAPYFPQYRYISS